MPISAAYFFHLDGTLLKHHRLTHRLSTPPWAIWAFPAERRGMPQPRRRRRGHIRPPRPTRAGREDPAAAARLKDLMRRESRLRSRTRPGLTRGSRSFSTSSPAAGRGRPFFRTSPTIRPGRSSVTSSPAGSSSRSSAPGTASRSSPIRPEPSRSPGSGPAAGIADLGDTNTDMRTATAAGMFACGALWHSGPRPSSPRTGATDGTLLAKPADLLGFIE